MTGVAFAALATILVFVPSRTFAADAASLDEGYRHMYNLDFGDAHDAFQRWETLHPADPMGPVSDAAAYLFSEFDRLHILESEFFVDDTNFRSRQALAPNAQIRSKFEQALGRAQQLADAALARSGQDYNAMFANVLRLGLHADYQALIQKKYAASLGEMKAGRLLAQQLVAANPSFYDAYLAIGVENYLLSQKIAPLRWVLKMTGAETDKDEGLRNLRLTAEKGRYLLPFARLLLAVSALRDNDRGRASDILRGLAKEFPKNRLYAQELIKLTGGKNKS
jgi:hypothetical protein